jgi:mono/diheme cytochrome c family protein
MNHRLVRLGAACILSAVFLCSTLPAQAQNDAASLYKSKCAACHGADASGDTSIGKTMKIRDLHSPDVQKQTDAQLTDVVTAGKSPMPAYKDKLTGDQIKQLVSYIRDLGKK